MKKSVTRMEDRRPLGSTAPAKEKSVQPLGTWQVQYHLKKTLLQPLYQIVLKRSTKRSNVGSFVKSISSSSP